MKSSLIHFGIALLLCSVTLIGYSVWQSTLTDKSAEFAALQKQIATKVDAAGRTLSAQVALAEIADDEAAIQKRFVPETGAVAFIDGLESRGSSLGATVSVRSVSNGGNKARPVFEFSISITGTFDAVMRTVGAIEYAPYAISVETLSLGQNAKNNWYADLSLQVGSNTMSTTTNKL